MDGVAQKTSRTAGWSRWLRPRSLGAGLPGWRFLTLALALLRGFSPVFGSGAVLKAELRWASPRGILHYVGWILVTSNLWGFQALVLEGK